MCYTVDVSWMDLGSMFLLGLIGTGHCVGMCGPLVLALPASSGRFLPQLAYHAGRVITYTAMGAVMGGLGLALTQLATAGDQPLEQVARIQVVFSLLAAAILLMMGLSRIGLLPEPALMKQASVPRFAKTLTTSAQQGNPAGVFVMGLLLGFLPCGLSWAAFARALPAGGILEGSALVFAFALGTVPGLLGLGTAGAAFARKHRKLSDLLSGVIMIAMAISLGVDATWTIG